MSGALLHTNFAKFIRSSFTVLNIENIANPVLPEQREQAGLVSIPLLNLGLKTESLGAVNISLIFQILLCDTHRISFKWPIFSKFPLLLFTSTYKR